jgi:hypothetical protein
VVAFLKPVGTVNQFLEADVGLVGKLPLGLLGKVQAGTIEEGMTDSDAEQQRTHGKEQRQDQKFMSNSHAFNLRRARLTVQKSDI